MEAEAQHVTEVRGRQSDGPYGWQFGADVQEFSHGVMNVRYRVFLDGTTNGVSAAGRHPQQRPARSAQL